MVHHKSNDIPYVDPITRRIEKMDRRNKFDSHVLFVYTCEQAYVSEIMPASLEISALLDPNLNREYRIPTDPRPYQELGVPLTKEAFNVGEIPREVNIQDGNDLMDTMSAMLEFRIHDQMAVHNHPDIPGA
jgi:hypothetical protein